MGQKVELELNDEGKPGTLPEAVQVWVDGLIKAEHGRAYAKARAEATKTAPSLADVERLKALEEEVQRYQLQDAERQKDWNKARDTLEQQHRTKLGEITSALDAERARAKTLAHRSLHEQIRATALTHGAHPDFLEDFARLLLTDDRLVFDEGYQPAQKDDANGTTPLNVETWVKSALEKRANFRAAPGAGGGARGGATTQGAGTKITARAAYDAAMAQWQRVQNGETLKALQEAKLALQE